MRPVTITQLGAGYSVPLVHDYLPVPVNISLSTVVNAPAEYTIQHTFDDIFAANYNPAIGNWFDSQDPNLVNATGNVYSVVNLPIRASRILNGGTGTVKLTAIQGTSTN